MSSTSSSSFRRLSAIVFPWHAENPALPGVLLWLLHLLFWAGLGAVLWQLNRFGGLERWLRSPWPMLHRVWLPMLAAGLYLFCWLSTVLWHALRRTPSAGVWRDVEGPWNEAWQSLKRQNPRVQDLPIFLILAPLTRELQAILTSAGASCVLPRSAIPLHFFLHAEAIFVVAENISLTGVQGQQQAEKSLRPVRAMPGDSSDEILARLHFFCQLLQRDRPARRVLQGIVLGLPFRALMSAGAMQAFTACSRTDLRLIAEATGLTCPLYTMVTGLDGVPESAAQGWYQRFGVAPDLEPEELTGLFRQGLQQLCFEKVPQMARRRMRLDFLPTDRGTMPEALRENIRQYRFLAAIQSARSQLYRWITEGTWNEFNEPGLVVGCYFVPGQAGIGAEASVIQALLADLLAHQQLASWTQEAIIEHEHENRLIRKGYGIIAAGWISALAVAVWVLAQRL
jgi:hypothetical protein